MHYKMSTFILEKIYIYIKCTKVYLLKKNVFKFKCFYN